MQNVGRGDIRGAFVPADGCVFVISDYSQIELRAAAAVSGDAALLAAYERKEDIHTLTAAAVLGNAVKDIVNYLASRGNTGFLELHD